MKLLFIFLIPTLSFAQSEQINYIRKQFNEINSNIESFKVEENQPLDLLKISSPENYSHESTEIYRLALMSMKRFYNDTSLVKIEFLIEGYFDDLKSDYYFDKNGLVFVYKVLSTHNEPKWTDSYDKNLTTHSENRFYFYNNNLIRWVIGDVTFERRSKNFINHETTILSDAILYKNY